MHMSRMCIQSENVEDPVIRITEIRHSSNDELFFMDRHPHRKNEN